MFEPTYIPQMTKVMPQISFGFHYGRGDNNEPDPVHMHNYLEIFFNLSANVVFLVNNELFSVPFGSAIVTRAGDLHMGLIDKQEPREHFCLWIETDFSSPVFSFLNKETFSPFFSFDSETTKKLHSMFFSLNPASENLQNLAIIFQILSIFEKGKFQSRERIIFPEALQKVLDDIQNNFATIHNINSVLETHYLSSTTLNRWFRRYVHTSPREYLESVRLSGALSMLLEGATVTEASLNCGFSDCSHFIALFKKRFGKTPKQYIKSLNDQ